MKKVISAVVAALALSPLFVQAEPMKMEGFYIGGSVGKTKFDTEGGEIAGIDNKDTSYKAFIGYDFTKTFGIEAGYANLYDRKFDVVDANGNSVANGKIKGHSYYAAVVGTLPVNEMFDLYGKLGYENTKGKLSGTFNGVSTSESASDDDYYLSLGGRYNFDQNLGVGLEYERFGSDIDGWNVNLRYKF